MIATIVQYLHGVRVPFRLASYPSEESAPRAAHQVPPRGMAVDTLVVVVDGRAVLVCIPAEETVDLAALGASLGGLAAEGAFEDLPDELQRSEGPIPPLGQLFGLPLVVDERVTHASVIVFRAFGDSDYFEVPYEDFARLEQPRVAAFASRATLPSHRATGSAAH